MEGCGNPLLLEWVGEWLEVEKDRNTKGVTTYKHAYNALKACPMTFTHPSEAKALKGIGEKICKRLTDRMQAHCDANGLPMPKRGRRGLQIPGQDDVESGPTKKRKISREYNPRIRSGGYGILLALHSIKRDEELHKEGIIELAQEYCDSSYTAVEPGAGKYKTAWDNITTLIEHDLVYQKGHPRKKYALTEDGWVMAENFIKTHNPSLGLNGPFIRAASPQVREDAVADLDSTSRRTRSDSVERPPVDDFIPQGEAISASTSLPQFRPSILKPGMFTVELVLDVREVRTKKDRDYIQNALIDAGVTPIMRALDLGDVLWVAKVKQPDYLQCIGGEGDEIMLDHIIERKRLDDLVASIKDRRYQEQKFRLNKCGIKNITYIVEEMSVTSEYLEANQDKIKGSIAQLQVVHGYLVKKTQKMDDTIRYLVRMTHMLKQLHESEPIHFIPTKVLTAQNYLPILEDLCKKSPATDYHITYKAFASLASKSSTLTLRDVYLKMLMCIKGLSGVKALEIQERWKTPSELLEAYERLGSGAANKKRKYDMISKETSKSLGRKKIGEALSKKVAEVWADV